MRKLLVLVFVLGLAIFTSNNAFAQEPEQGQQQTEQQAAPEQEAQQEPVAAEPVAEEPAAESGSDFGHQLLKRYFIEGSWEFMSLVLICLILGLAFCIERVITLNIASTNTDKLLAKIEDALDNGGVDAAMEVCKSTQGPTASILHEGLKRSGEGAEAVEKAIVSYGAVQMGLLERGLVWISLFISIAPMLGFMGTVIGMISAFDKIAEVGDISPQIVAGGIKVALLTTVFGLIVAIILQIFYNYIVSKIDGIVNRMEDASISLVDILVDKDIVK
ncbi:MAG: MotA/TolQ/ExbB proton channel family protein [Saprospiraceae bacterium]